MAFVSKNTFVGQPASENPVEQPKPIVQQPQSAQQTASVESSLPSSKDELELPELEFLLRVLGNADLKGHQVEMFYNMIVKLQNLYLQKSKK